MHNGSFCACKDPKDQPADYFITGTQYISLNFSKSTRYEDTEFQTGKALALVLCALLGTVTHTVYTVVVPTIFPRGQLYAFCRGDQIKGTNVKSFYTRERS